MFEKPPRAEGILYALGILELIIFLLGLPWLFFNSLAVVLAAFIWMALIPLIIFSVVVSLFIVKRISKASVKLKIIVGLNWLALIFMIFNVTD